ncbi:Hpt domain-containing protein [Vannielia litorea]|uniref:Hpt domain-containing protein n=1 Tax=Vannielia litorea TaxID=1217970 RepID=A0A1N6ELZ0_9RHOB|nr:Hpt domain-containing protein [Vannielia litorea]SIN84028.1 Hpt domain-containing protein [Vannielia litorea]
MGVGNPMYHGFPDADALAAMLQPVRVAFLQSLEEHLPVFEEIAGIPPSLWDDAAIADIAHRAHKITGVAATLGYTQLGRLATRLEDDLRQRRHEGDLSEAVERMTREMRAVLAG